MAHKHDWYDDYMMYSMLNAGRNSGGGDNSGCLFAILITAGLFIFLSAIFYIITYGNA